MGSRISSCAGQAFRVGRLDTNTFIHTNTTLSEYKGQLSITSCCHFSPARVPMYVERQLAMGYERRPSSHSTMVHGGDTVVLQ